MYRYRSVPITLDLDQAAGRSTAKLMCLFQDLVEHWCEVAGRGIDDLQHLRGRSLLLQRFARLGQEPRILHRNHRLRSEVLQQRDLLVGERARFLSVDVNSAEQHAVLAKGDAKKAVEAADIDKSAAH